MTQCKECDLRCSLPPVESIHGRVYDVDNCKAFRLQRPSVKILARPELLYKRGFRIKCQGLPENFTAYAARRYMNGHLRGANSVYILVDVDDYTR